MNAPLSGGDLPGRDDRDGPVQLAGRGLRAQGLLPLDELIDQNAPHIRDMFDTFPDMHAVHHPDGRLYAVPAMGYYHCKTASFAWYNSAGSRLSAPRSPRRSTSSMR